MISKPMLLLVHALCLTPNFSKKFGCICVSDLCCILIRQKCKRKHVRCLNAVLSLARWMASRLFLFVATLYKDSSLVINVTVAVTGNFSIKYLQNQIMISKPMRLMHTLCLAHNFSKKFSCICMSDLCCILIRQKCKQKHCRCLNAMLSLARWMASRLFLLVAALSLLLLLALLQ